MFRSRQDIIARCGAALLRVRWLVRAPIWLYRARLGALFGSRLLMVEHVGRTSGRRRYVVLEIVDHPTPGRFVVVSGFGARAQWFRNVEHTPQVRVFITSRKPAPATAHRLGPDEAATSLRRYAHAHPRSWAMLRPVLEETLGARIDEATSAPPMMCFELGLRTEVRRR